MFRTFLNEDISIEKKNGDKVFNNVRACVQSKSILILDVKIPIEKGDVILRTLPSGVIERHTVDDPGYHAGFQTIPAHYQVKTCKETDSKGQNKKIAETINIIGNARLNINSTDSSHNVTSNSGDVFYNLTNVIEKEVKEDETRLALLACIEEMQKAKNDSSFTQKYTNFISMAANYMTIISPFIPALTKYLA